MSDILHIERTADRNGLTLAVGAAAHAETVWILFDPRTQPWTSDAFEEAMTAAGYVRRSTRTSGTAVLERWERVPEVP